MSLNKTCTYCQKEYESFTSTSFCENHRLYHQRIQKFPLKAVVNKIFNRLQKHVFSKRMKYPTSIFHLKIPNNGYVSIASGRQGIKCHLRILRPQTNCEQSDITLITLCSRYNPCARFRVDTLSSRTYTPLSYKRWAHPLQEGEQCECPGCKATRYFKDNNYQFIYKSTPPISNRIIDNG